MNKLPFRDKTPSRTHTKTYSSYRQYKNPLARDFNERCGYSDCPDRWFGGKRTFHIDHFKPRKTYPLLETDYSNLVYSCSYINILKSDDNPVNYLDPCNNNYNEHFYRDQSGNIYPSPNSPSAQYMFKKLKLGLARYQVIWLLDEIYNTMANLDDSQKRLADDNPNKTEIKITIANLFSELRKYFDYLQTL